MSTLTRRLAVIYSLTLTQARCLSILTLSGFCLSILTLTQARCLSILIPADSPPTYSHTIRLTASVHSQTHCHPILHYQTCLNLALTPRAYLFLHTLSDLLPMYSQAHCLCSLRLTAYVVSGSLPMYSQAHCLCSLRFTAYLFSGSLPMYSQAHRLCILRFTAYLFSGSLPMYSQALRFTAYLFSGSLPM